MRKRQQSIEEHFAPRASSITAAKVIPLSLRFVSLVGAGRLIHLMFVIFPFLLLVIEPLSGLVWKVSIVNTGNGLIACLICNLYYI